MQDIVRQLNTRWVWLTAGGMLLGGGVFYGVTVVFPGSFATVTIQTLAGWGKSALVTSMGGAIGLILACERELVDLCGHNLKMFKAFVLRDRYRLKQEGFFNDENAQKYCCEGVFGSDKDFMAIVDECFLAVILVLVCVFWALGAMLIAQRARDSNVSWTFTLICLSAILNLSRVLYPILRFNLRQDLVIIEQHLATLSGQIRQLQDPDFKMPPLSQYVPVQNHPQRRRRGHAAPQPVQAPPEVPQETEEQHNLRKRQQIEVLERSRTVHLASYPILHENEPALTKNMGYLMVAMAGYLCVVSWVILKILQCGFGVLLLKPGETVGGARNSTHFTKMTNSSLASWLNLTGNSSAGFSLANLSLT